MLDIIERDLLQVLMPTISFRRLDGDTPSTQRHAVVTNFNEDPTIDVLLLTTQVGGLGLNLTGAFFMFSIRGKRQRSIAMANCFRPCLRLD